jgi:adenylosuccinate lyase
MVERADYVSPFSWRYGSAEMRALWSEVEKRRRWRRVWVALAEAQAAAGLVTVEQVDELKAHADEIDVGRAEAIEGEIRHDLMAELRAFAEQCTVAGGVLHLGATSADIQDNAEVTRQRDALDIVLGQLDGLLRAFAGQIERWADRACMGWTHLQPAEPTTIGYRLAVYAQDLLADEADLCRLRDGLRGKGLKGAVGTRASYAALLDGTDLTPAAMEDAVMERLGIDAVPVAGQVAPRAQERRLLDGLAGLGGTLYRFAFDVRLLQSPPVGEWSESFGERQVGSSAMPFKRNPIRAEKVDSLGRYVAALARVGWDNAAHSLLERTLDDSANRRVVVPDAFLAVDEMLIAARKLIDGLQIDEVAVEANLARYGAFAATERVLMALARAGADRQVMHERIRAHSMAAWESVRGGEPNPLVDRLAGDDALTVYLPAERIRGLMDAVGYTGDAPERARTLAGAIRAGRVG